MISLIVPYYNSEKWLDRCLESLSAQDSTDIEFILVDDNSTDKSRDIVEKWVRGEPRGVSIENERVPGVGGARNTGIDNANGEWITFLDSDDELNLELVDKFKREYVRTDNGYNIYQFNHLRAYDEINKVAFKYYNDGGEYRLTDKLRDMPEQWWAVWNKFYRTSLLVENGIRFNAHMKYGEDELFNLECLACDGRIWHGERNEVTITRHFNNKGSLSHIRDAVDVTKQVAKTMDLQQSTNNATLRLFICDLLADHWNSGTYREVLGGEKKTKKSR